MIDNVNICFTEHYDFDKLNIPKMVSVKYIDMDTRKGKSEGWRLKSSWASIQNPFIACYENNKVVKCFYREAYKSDNELFNDFMKYLNNQKKILVVPDIHGRNFWVEPCQQWQGSIVFLGDYHDPYPDEYPKTVSPTEMSLNNLRKLVEFVTKNKERCTCLIGNHDISYINNSATKCRFDHLNHKEIKSLLEKLNLHLCKITNDVIFSHAGITLQWCNCIGLTIEDLNNNKISLDSNFLDMISWYRRGSDECGSIVWCDLEEYMNSDHFPNYYQIFGHTQLLLDAFIKEDFACLDCRECFVVDVETKEIIPYNKYKENESKNNQS